MIDLLLTLAVWRICHLLIYEGGPFGALSKFRYAIGIRYDEMSNMQASNTFAALFMCMWCLSVWAGWIVAFIHYRTVEALFFGLAYSTGAILINRFIHPEVF